MNLGSTTPVARKTHQCDDCGTPIDIGERYVRNSEVADGSAFTWKSHVECQAARHALHRLWMMDYDDGICLRNDVSTDDHPYLLTHHPVVAARLHITEKERA